MGYNYNYGYDNSFLTEAMNGTLGFLLVFILAIGLISLALAVLIYILEALGMYTIAKRRGIHNPWLAWIPVGQSWIMGSISDQYQYLTKGKTTNRRKILLGLAVAVYGLMMFFYILQFGALVGAAIGDGMTVGTTSAGFLLVYFAIMIVGIINTVFSYIAMYDLYCSCDPGNGVLYLVLSIFVPVSMPVLFFICRNKDLGMPKRAEALAQPEGTEV